jgi:transcriptional regulator GlxA family with amidase domain
MATLLEQVKDWTEPAKQCHYNVTELANQLGCSRQWLWTYFHQHLHGTPRHTFAQWRLKHIRTLAAAGLSGEAIARQVGFASRGHLSRFLAQRGWTLNELRRRSSDELTK